jgi:hypothetical protein
MPQLAVASICFHWVMKFVVSAPYLWLKRKAFDEELKVTSQQSKTKDHGVCWRAK